MKFPLLFSLLLLLANSSCLEADGCAASQEGLPLPTAEHLSTGVVNKYYFHYTSADGYEKSTDIRYYQYRQLDEQRYSWSIYNPAFELTSRLLFRLEEGQMIIEDELREWRGETLDVQIERNILLAWQGDSAAYTSTTHYPFGISEEVEWRQISSRDSTVMGRPALVIRQERKRRYQYPDEDEREEQTQIVDTYVEGFGLFARHYVFEEGTGQLELVEQMPLGSFEERRKKTPKRVGYIDPNNTLDAFSSFAPCGENGQIYDYYNSQPDAHYRPGKRALWNLLEAQLDPSLLGTASGYLTFRFVINCTGETGWFVTEETDLDFQLKTFPEATVRHCFDIIRALDDWQPAKLRNEFADVYAYLTLKLKDGQLMEILP